MDRIEFLLVKYILGKADSGEKTELARLVSQTDDDILGRILSDIWNKLPEAENLFTQQETDHILEKILSKKTFGTQREKYFLHGWKKLVGAAAVLLLFTGTYFLLSKHGDRIDMAQSIGSDLKPGGNKAVLTLTDGSKITLDNAADGSIASEGNTSLVKLDNEILYKSKGHSSEIAYNVIETPRGGTFQLKLADGTKVWLNSSSYLKYPINFTGKEKERRVEMRGEVYFEVTKDRKIPFIVNVDGKGEVKVLGTHFNINSYPDEPTINTTLLEGSVKVACNGNSEMITPGQQARIFSNGRIILNNNPDIESIMAWKNGSFIFNGLDIRSIMRQVSRWYDVDVSYSGEPSDETYSGIVSRNSNVSALLKIMEEGGVKFRIEGKKIIVIQ